MFWKVIEIEFAAPSAPSRLIGQEPLPNASRFKNRKITRNSAAFAIPQKSLKHRGWITLAVLATLLASTVTILAAGADANPR